MHSPVLLHSPMDNLRVHRLAVAAILVVVTTLVLEQEKWNNSAKVARRNGPLVHVTGDFAK
jgi:hypothetical protein